MSARKKISPDVAVGSQPTVSELASLLNEGFRTIVNFRTAGEEDQPMSPESEGEKARAEGLEYLHFPVSMQAMSPELVDEFREQWHSLTKPIFAHCKSGKRAGALVMMHTAVEQGMSGDEALAKAEELGFECDQPELRSFVKDYVDGRAVEA